MSELEEQLAAAQSSAASEAAAKDDAQRALGRSRARAEELTEQVWGFATNKTLASVFTFLSVQARCTAGAWRQPRRFSRQAGCRYKKNVILTRV